MGGKREFFLKLTALNFIPPSNAILIGLIFPNNNSNGIWLSLFWGDKMGKGSYPVLDGHSFNLSIIWAGVFP